MNTFTHLTQNLTNQELTIVFYVIVIVLILLTVLFVMGRIRNRRNRAALESFLESVVEPKSDDKDFISLKTALSDGGVEHDDIKLIKNLPAEGQYAKIFGLIVPGKQAVNTWMDLRSLVPQTNRWPLIMGSLKKIGSDFFAMKEENEPSVQDILDRVEKVDIDRWVADAINSEPERFVVPPDKRGRGFGKKHAAVDLEYLIATHKDEPGNRPLPHVLIGLFPVNEGWKVPAVMKWGGWNDCPAPEFHCAVLKEWSEKYGAELVGITGHFLEVKVDSTPKTREEAFELAKLQYAYNKNGWYQVLGLEDLAYHIYITPVWSFWWD